MPQINCYLPIKLCITGRLSDTQLEQLSETLQRAITARISFANQEITAANGVNLHEGSAEVVREGYDPERHDGATDSYQVPSYQRQGQRVGMSLRGNLRRRPWFIRKAIHFHSRIGGFLDLVDETTSDPSELSGKVLYKDVYEELRWVSVWLVQVNRHHTLAEMEKILSERAMDLSRLRGDQILAYGLATTERFRRKLIQIDEDGIVSRDIPAIHSHNLHRLTYVAGADGIDPGGWVLFAGMVLPRVTQGDLLALGSEATFSLPIHALDFIVNDALFQQLTGVSWDSYVNQFGDQLASLRILPFTTLRRVHFDTLKYLIEPIVKSSVAENTVYLGNIHLLNQSRLARLPAAARDKAHQLTNEVTLPLDDSQRDGWWEAGWRGAFIYAVVSKTGEQPVQPEAERAGQQEPSETPEQLISRFTSWGNLDEDGLGAYLMGLVRRSPALSHYVQRVLDELDDGDRDDVSLAFVENATVEEDLDILAQSPNGRLLLARLYDELTSGNLGGDEQKAAGRVLAARVRARSIEVVARRLETARGWIFPYKQGGPTAFNSSPISAERLKDGRIRVRLFNVSRSDMFQDEVRTLPDAVFGSGLILEPDEWIRVKLYDEGGIIVPQPALYLLQISNQGTTKTLESISTVILTVGTLGVGGAAAGASWGVRTLVVLDRAAAVLSIVGILVNDHRGWIISTFGENGRTFVNVIEVANAFAGLYGIGRLAISAPKLIRNVRGAWRNWKGSREYAGLQGSDLRRADELSQNVEQFLNTADEAAATAKREAASVPTGTHTPVDAPTPPAPPGAPPISAPGLARSGTGGRPFDVVELGAGDLQASLPYARQGARVTGVDIKQAPTQAVRELESLGGSFVQGTSKNIPSGSADHVFQHFPWRIEGSGRVAKAGGTWEAMEEAVRITRPGGTVTFVTESKETAMFLLNQSKQLSKVRQTALIKSTAREAAPGATGAGVTPETPISPTHPVWHVNVYLE